MTVATSTPGVLFRNRSIRFEQEAQVIPAIMSQQAAHTGGDLAEAFRRTVAEFEGSVAIAAQAADRPDEVYLALRGSGQALYVGLAEDSFVVASEPYGLVEETQRYVRMDGESLAHPERPSSRGQVMVLEADRIGSGGSGVATGLLSGESSTSFRDVEARHGRRMARAMFHATESAPR